MKLNRIIFAAACGASLALVGACADNSSKLTSPNARTVAPAATVTPPDTFCCAKQQAAPKAAATVDTFPKRGQ